jgi:hypothetical protein
MEVVMARAEVTGKKPKGARKKRRRNRGSPTLAFTIQEFCDAHRISKARYYELKERGLTPDEMMVGRLRIISFEAAARWRQQREREAAPSAA